MPDHFREIVFAKPRISEDDIAAVVDCMRGGWLTTGEQCEQLEAELAAYVGVPYVVAVSSCTAALEMCLAYLDLPPGSRVGVPDWTFVSTALAVLKNQLTPVFLDVDPSTLNLAPDALHAEIGLGLAAVVGVHFGGVPFSEEIRAICEHAGVPLIEDAAHALGAEDGLGRVAGRRSLAACYSFYATKNLTCGEGGAIATENAGLASFADRYRLHGLTSDARRRYQDSVFKEYDLAFGGMKANLPDILAALARSQLRSFDEMQEVRHRLMATYHSRVAALQRVDMVPGSHREGSADHLAVVRLDGLKYSRIGPRLAEQGVATSVHFKPLHRFKWLREKSEVGCSGLKHSSEADGEVFSLPLHPNLTEEEILYVCDALGIALDV